MKPFYFIIAALFLVQISYSRQTTQNIEAVELSNSHYQFVNKNTRLKVNDLVWDEAEPFVNGFARVYANNKWGFVDQAGNPLKEAKFEAARNFVNKLAAVKQQAKWGFINEQGNIAIPFEYDIVYDFTETVTAAYKNNKWFLISKTGAIIKPLAVDVFRGFKNGVAKITTNGRNGLMNKNGNVISMEPAKTIQSKKSSSVASRSTAALAATCPDNIGFEYGNFTNWSSFTGDVAAVGTSNVITVDPSPPVANRHVIYAGSNPSALDPYGLFPINPPDGSGFALKLGNNINGAEAERISYQVTVPANSADASITYRYAVVFQDPGHLTYQQPRFSAKLLDVETNTYLPCASYEYVANAELPGFYNSTVDDSVKCKAWASVFINLSAYAGKTLILEFTTADCTRGAHWGYAYIDVGDCNITAEAQYTCNPDIATFNGPPGFENYKWWDNNFGTLLGTGQNLVLNPAPPVNNIYLEVIPFNGFGCSDTLAVSISPEYPRANAGPDRKLCMGESTTIGTVPASNNSALTYSWSPGTYLSDSSRPRVGVSTPATSVTYTLTVANTASGCSAQDKVIVAVYPKPVPAFDPGDNQCLEGNRFIFTNTSTVSSGSLTYTWRFGDGDSSDQVNPGHRYTTAGAFPVKLIATANNCTDSIMHRVTVHPNPVVRATNDVSICRGRFTQLQAVGAQTYTWTPAQDLSCTDCFNPRATPGNSSTYIVKGISSAGCPGYDTVNITVFQPISITASPDRVICEGDSVNLLASGEAEYYKWSPNLRINSTTIPGPIARPLTTTLYQVVGYDGHNCFTDTAFVKITVNPKPTIELGPDLVLSTGTIHKFNPVTHKGPMATWDWTPPDNLSCTDCPGPTTEVKKDITYYASVKNVYGCVAIDSVSIRTFCKGSQVFIPNAFTPDGDGVNDILMVRGTGISMVSSFRIFSRWGELVFERKNFSPNDPAFGWDGKIKGVTGASEVYVYTCDVVCENNQTFTYKGNISLLK